MNLRRSIFIFLSFHSLNALKFILLTHLNEINRIRTNTGQVLALSLPKEECIKVVWGGKSENSMVESIIKHIDSPVLVWPEASRKLANYSLQHSELSTYIILDGTWQEAKKIFRKGPEILRVIPRISIQEQHPSIYTLRKDFGFRRKFSNNEQSSSSLLCTAEVGASILNNLGFVSQGNNILAHLEMLQLAYKNSGEQRNL